MGQIKNLEETGDIRANESRENKQKVTQVITRKFIDHGDFKSNSDFFLKAFLLVNRKFASFTFI